MSQRVPWRSLPFAHTTRNGAPSEPRTTRLGTTSFTQAYRVVDAASCAVWAEAEARLVTYDPATGAKAPMADAFRAAIAAREGL